MTQGPGPVGSSCDHDCHVPAARVRGCPSAHPLGTASCVTLAIEGRLRVVVDTNTVSDGDGDERARFLLGLLRREEIDTYRYADEGPPASSVRSDDRVDQQYGVGWLLHRQPDMPTWDDGGRVAFTNDPPSWEASQVHAGDFLQVMSHGASEQLGLDSDQVRRDVTCLLVADAASAHLLVTGRRPLIEPPVELSWTRMCQAASVENGLMMVGLWLRAKGVYVMTASGTGMATVYRHFFYAAVIRELLPSVPSWSRSCTRSGDARLHDLAVSLHRRLVTAVKARDRALSATFFMADDAARDEVLECIDSVALHLVAALDIAARVADQALGIGSRPNWIGWLRRDWCKELTDRSDDLARVLAGQRDVLVVVSSLRNTIHDRAPHVVLIQEKQPADADFYVALSGVESDSRFIAAVAATGGPDEWGIRETVPGRLWADPFRLVEQMIVRSTSSLNELLQATPFEKVLPLNDQVNDGPAENDWLSSETVRRSVCWQLGGGIGAQAEKMLGPNTHP